MIHNIRDFLVCFLYSLFLFVSIIIIYFISELVTHCPMPCITNMPGMNPVVQFLLHITDSLKNEERMAADFDDSSKEMAERRLTVLTQRKWGQKQRGSRGVRTGSREKSFVEEL